MLKKIFILCSMFLLVSNLILADQNWTTWRKPPAILSIAFEDSIIWCGTEGEGVIAYNKITGEQKIFTTESGLINDYVYSITIDENSVKWFGTLGGISRFDGYEWISHPINKFGYPYGDKINDIVIDRNSVWTVTSNGIYTYDGKKWKKMESGDFHSIELSPSGYIWAASTKKIYHIKDNDITEINIHSIVTAHDFIKDIAVDGKTELLWYTSLSKIYTFDWETKTDTLKLDDTVPDYKGYTMIDIDSTGDVWLAHPGYCALYSNDTITNYNDDYFESNTINGIISNATGDLWIASSRGVLCFNDGKFDLLFGESGLYSNQINNIVMDQNDTVWCSNFSTYEKDRWRIATLGIGNILCVTDDGVYWGTYQSKLYSYDGNEIVEHIIKVPIPGFYCETTSPGDIQDIYFDDDNIIWIASFNNSTGDCTHSGIFTYDGETVVPKLLGSFFNIAVDSKNNKWCSGSWDGLYKYDGNDWTQCTELSELSGERITYVEVDRNDVVWTLVSTKGVYDHHYIASYDGNVFTIFTSENSGLPKTLINIIVADHNNTKWIGTDAGVSRFDGETWTTFNTENSGLCDNKVNAIAVDSNNVLWFGTDNGVSRYTEETITTSVDEENQTPESIPLIKSYPNPFNPSTTIEFTLPESGLSTITIYSLAGQKIQELTADYLPAGTHKIMWDGKDANGNVVSSGIYITRLQAGKRTATGRMVLVR